VSNSFARFLSDEELLQVRELYLQSVADAEAGTVPDTGESTGNAAPTPES
jgi:hypothetical protein